MNTFIYALMCPESLKTRYIGKSNNPHNRLADHMRIRGSNQQKNKWIKHLISHGLKPTLLILEEVDMSDWKDREKHHINANKDLYNICGGGNGLNFGNRTSFNGKDSKKVISLKKDGSLNKLFNSVKDAKNEYGSSVSSALSGRTKTAHGYIWLYEEEYRKLSKQDIDILIKNSNNNMSLISWKKGLIKHQYKKGMESNRRKIVYQYTLEGLFIKEWESVSLATKELCASPGKISKCANGQRKTTMGFKWSYIKI